MYMTLGATPWGESCAQVGSQGYAIQAAKECRAYIQQMQRIYFQEHKKECPLVLKMKSHVHDYGTYYEVAVYYSEEEVSTAVWLENNCPEYWDESARAELGIDTSINIAEAS